MSPIISSDTSCLSVSAWLKHQIYNAPVCVCVCVYRIRFTIVSKVAVTFSKRRVCSRDTQQTNDAFNQTLFVCEG